MRLITFGHSNLISKVAKKTNITDESTGPASDIPVLFKIGSYFILQGNIQSVVRFGKGIKLMLTTGDELIVNVNYDKVCELVK